MFMSRRSVVLTWVLALVVPSVAYAQASITGVVRDTSMAVLPGVTVEVASPALIEKTRTATTDGTGQFKVTDLRPGAYTVTFTLAGFSTVKRDGIQLTGSFTATVNADMKVGNVEETLTVTSEAPIVDVQTATRQAVLSAETFASVPSSRQWNTMAGLLPGVIQAGVGNSGQDVGGVNGDGSGQIIVHGSKPDSMGLTINGMSFTSHIMSGNQSLMAPNITSMQEVTVDTAAADASEPLGGPRVNMIPKEGGNQYSGIMFLTGTGSSLQGSNLDDALRAKGLTSVDHVDHVYDFNPGFGGPLKRDRLWFYGAFRRNSARNFVADTYYNQNANTPTQFAYAPDLSRPFVSEAASTDGNVRLTLQATPKNKFSVAYDKQERCCSNLASRLTSPEAALYPSFPSQYTSLDWSSPLTNRLLVEANMLFRADGVNADFSPGLNPQMIATLELKTSTLYRSAPIQSQTRPKGFFYRGSVSYVTGSHAFKTGFNASNGWGSSGLVSNQNLEYVFFGGSPVALVEFAAPTNQQPRMNDAGLYAQDRWTKARLTLTGGVRYDYVHSGWGDTTLGPTKFQPTRNLVIPVGTGISFNDLTPRLGAAYDLFGDGRTALKVSLNKYLEGEGWDNGFPSSTNPVNRLSLATSRGWVDNNHNFIPDCDLSNPNLQTPATGSIDICAPNADPNFGTVVNSVSFDPKILSGWGSRGYNWEFSASVQQELRPGVAANVGYFRRWYGNFSAVDNRALSAADFDFFNITAPANANLPGGGGYLVTGIPNVKPDRFAVAPDNFVTFASNYGKQSEYWQGVDVGVTARLIGGLTAQGGVSTGRSVTDNCDVVAKLPEMQTNSFNANGTVNTSTVVTPSTFCRQVQPFQTQIKGFATYTVPRIDVLLAGTLQNIPGAAAPAQLVLTNTDVVPALGRVLAGGQQTLTANIVSPVEVYGNRLTQLDLRFSKVLRVGRTRTMVSMDLYNALNSNAVLVQSANFATWMAPTTVLQPRLVKFGAQFDF
jgi:hypothetical protein